MAFARAMPKAVGNPVYQWSHLELRRFFGCDLILSPQTAEEIWNVCGEKLKDDSMSVRGLIKRARVTHIATTDDPADGLSWHKAIAEDASFDVKVVPAFRPDKAINIEKPGFNDYIARLGKAAEVEIKTLDGLCAALGNRLDLTESFFLSYAYRLSVFCSEHFTPTVLGSPVKGITKAFMLNIAQAVFSYFAVAPAIFSPTSAYPRAGISRYPRSGT